MAASATAIRDGGISVTTRGVRCYGNTFVTDNSCVGALNLWNGNVHRSSRTCAKIRVTKVGRVAARLVKKVNRGTEWCVGGNTESTADIWLYGNCDLYVFCWYVCRLFV